MNLPNVACGIDISYLPTRYGFMFLVAIIAIHSKFIVGWSVSNTMDAPQVVGTRKEATERHGPPKYINSDQSTQFISNEYVEYIQSLPDTKISMEDRVALLTMPILNGFIEPTSATNSI